MDDQSRRGVTPDAGVVRGVLLGLTLPQPKICRAEHVGLFRLRRNNVFVFLRSELFDFVEKRAGGLAGPLLVFLLVVLAVAEPLSDHPFVEIRVTKVARDFHILIKPNAEQPTVGVDHIVYQAADDLRLAVGFDFAVRQQTFESRPTIQSAHQMAQILVTASFLKFFQGNVQSLQFIGPLPWPARARHPFPVCDHSGFSKALACQKQESKRPLVNYDDGASVDAGGVSSMAEPMLGFSASIVARFSS